MRNRFKGTCYRCGETVLPGAGHFEYAEHEDRVRWPQIAGDRHHALVQHADCAIKYRGTSVHYLYNPDPELTDDVEVIDQNDRF